MPELTGSGLYAKWVTATGTTTLSTDFRAFGVTGEQGEADKSAGADVMRTYLKTLTDSTVTITFLHDGGSVNWIELTNGKEGTLTWGEAGTADGKPKHTQPSFIKTGGLDSPYDNVEIWNLAFRPMTARVDAVWASGT